MRIAVVARIVTTSPHDWCSPASTTRSTNSCKVATSGSARSRGLLGSAGPGDTAHGSSTGPVLGRVPRNDAVTYRLVEHQNQDCHGVLDRRPAVLAFPLVDGSIDQPGGDHGHGQMTECRHDPPSKPSHVWVIRRGRIDASSPPVPDEGDVVRKRLAVVDPGPGGVLHLLDPAKSGTFCVVCALDQLAPAGHRVVPAHPSSPHHPARAVELLDVDRQTHAKRRPLRVRATRLPHLPDPSGVLVGLAAGGSGPSIGRIRVLVRLRRWRVRCRRRCSSRCRGSARCR